ncbi:MAG: YbaK/EbsC family protein [Acidimicrobiales bacterium]
MSVHPNVESVTRVLATAAPGAQVRHLEAAATTAALAAAALGCEVGAIANSLVFMAADPSGGEHVRPLLIMTSGAHRVDLGFVAATQGTGSLRRATAAEVRTATGQPIGGVAPVAHPTPLPTLVDEDLAAYPTVWAAAGTPHTVFPATYAQLVAMTRGRPVGVTPEA